jgi:cytoskeleton protein RodZ
MSDGLELTAQGQLGTSGQSAGALLKNARESQGLHIAALAVSLKVPVKKIEALEADRIDLLPDAVFARALASSVCRALKVDPTEVLAKLPQTSTPRLNQSQQSINTPFRMPADGPSQSKLTALSKPAVLAVLALLLGALVLIFLPEVTKQTSDAANAAVAGLKSSTSIGNAISSGAGSENPSGTAMGAGTPVFSTADGTATANTSSGATAESAAPAISGITASVTPSTPTVASPTLVITTDLSASTAASLAADGTVVFRARGQTWVEVIDARGQVTLRRTLQAGEAAGANGTPPLRVTVGRSDQTQVLVRGKPFEDEARVRDNVLRFEVK